MKCGRNREREAAAAAITERNYYHLLKLLTISSMCNTLYLHTVTHFICLCHRYSGIVDLFIFANAVTENMYVYTLCVHHYDDGKYGFVFNSGIICLLKTLLQNRIWNGINLYE